MPALSVFLDNNRLASVNTDGYDVISVNVHGTRTDSEFAVLEMHGGVYPKDSESIHLIWINNLMLDPGQEVKVIFENSGETTHVGKTIAELFPDDAMNESPTDFTVTTKMFSELRSKESLREGYGLSVVGQSNLLFEGRTAHDYHGFGFTVTWNRHEPYRANLSLHAYTLDDLECRKPMKDFLREYIEPPYLARVRIDA